MGIINLPIHVHVLTRMYRTAQIISMIVNFVDFAVFFTKIISTKTNKQPVMLAIWELYFLRNQNFNKFAVRYVSDLEVVREREREREREKERSTRHMSLPFLSLSPPYRKP